MPVSVDPAAIAEEFDELMELHALYHKGYGA
jgi:hypothetical protein